MSLLLQGVLTAVRASCREDIVLWYVPFAARCTDCSESFL
jgi:hypothetical protein